MSMVSRVMRRYFSLCFHLFTIFSDVPKGTPFRNYVSLFQLMSLSVFLRPYPGMIFTPHAAIHWETRMHTGGMRTVRCSSHLLRWGVDVCPRGCLSMGGCLSRGVCPGGCLPRGCLPTGCLPRGMSAQGVSAWGCVCPWGCLPRRVVCLGVSA